jgi:hypothetical protein
MRRTSKGGKTKATAIERTTRAMLEAEPCRILRVCNMVVEILSISETGRYHTMLLAKRQRNLFVM